MRALIILSFGMDLWFSDIRMRMSEILQFLILQQFEIILSSMNESCSSCVLAENYKFDNRRVMVYAGIFIYEYIDLYIIRNEALIGSPI